MHLFWQYLQIHLKVILLYILFFMIFVVTFILYHVPVSVVLYTGALCCFIGIVILVANFPAFYKKYYVLENQLHKIQYEVEDLPEAKSVIESSYQQMILILYQEKIALVNEQNCKYSDWLDYYTAWVHQIKTPIAAMYLKLCKEDSTLSRELRGELQKIEQYVEMVLCYLRLDADSTDYMIREYDLDSIVKQAVKKFAAQFIGRKIQLLYQPLNCTVLTDEKWLLFIIEQVLSNALKYTRHGSVSITLEGTKTLCIADTGIGISPEDLPRIFEKGYTGYNGRVDKRASGLGLYLCKRICKNLGHDITAESDLDSGTIIRIHLEHVDLEIE